MVTGILDSFTELISLRWIDDINLFKTIESAWVDGIGGFVNTFFGRVGNILSFGFLSSKGPADWFKNSNAAEVAATQKRLDIAIAQAGYHGNHHSWNKYWGGFNQEQINLLSEQIGHSWDGNIWSLTPEEMKMLRSNPDMWELIRSTGKGGYGEMAHVRAYA